MLRIARALALFLVLPLCAACVKDQQAARTRVPGVDKEPERQEQPTPEKLPKERPPQEQPPAEQELPPVEAPPR